MKLNITLLFLLVDSFSNAQDILLLKDKTELVIKVMEIAPDAIKYKKLDNLDGPLYSINSNDVTEVRFSNGIVEKVKSKTAHSLEETKSFLVETINKYASDQYSDARRYVASFEGDFIRLAILNAAGRKNGDGMLLDFSNVYQFDRVSYRDGDTAYVNIYTSLLEFPKKNVWSKHKLVMRVAGHQNAESILKAFKYLNSLLLDAKPDSKF